MLCDLRKGESLCCSNQLKKGSAEDKEWSDVRNIHYKHYYI